MHDSPRLRRLRNDLAALERLRSESSVFQFKASGNPVQHYQITFQGKGLWRDRGKVKIVQTHRVEIKLGASYPRTVPEIRWLTPIYHPNISEIGMVCLGGYGTHWVPSVQLDELCMMLWDMARFHNYDIRSPYNRDAALWVANQTSILFPTDSRPLRDLRAAQGRIDPGGGKVGAPETNAKPSGVAAGRSRPATSATGTAPGSPVVKVLQFIGRYSRVFDNGQNLVADQSSSTLTPEQSPSRRSAAPADVIAPAPADRREEPAKPDEAEMVILETSVDEGQGSTPQPPQAVTEEILFIE